MPFRQRQECHVFYTWPQQKSICWGWMEELGGVKEQHLKKVSSKEKSRKNMPLFCKFGHLKAISKSVCWWHDTSPTLKMAMLHSKTIWTSFPSSRFLLSTTLTFVWTNRCNTVNVFEERKVCASCYPQFNTYCILSLSLTADLVSLPLSMPILNSYKHLVGCFKDTQALTMGKIRKHENQTNKKQKGSRYHIPSLVDHIAIWV